MAKRDDENAPIDAMRVRLTADRNGHLIVLEPYAHHWEILVDDVVLGTRETLHLSEVLAFLVERGVLTDHDAFGLAHVHNWASHDMTLPPEDK